MCQKLTFYELEETFPHFKNLTATQRKIYNLMLMLFSGLFEYLLVRTELKVQFALSCAA